VPVILLQEDWRKPIIRPPVRSNGRSYGAVKCRLIWHFRGQALLLHVLHVVACDNVRDCVFLKDDLNRVKKGLNSKIELIRPYKMLVMFSFFQRVISELPRPITAKLRHMIAACVYFINWLQKFGEPSPPQKKNWGPKHAKFRSILCNLRLSSRISPERLRYPKSEN